MPTKPLDYEPVTETSSSLPPWAISVLAGVLCGGLVLHVGIASVFAGLWWFYSSTFYWFTLPHLALLLLSAATVALDAMRRDKATLIVAGICVLCVLPTWFFAMSHWPGGDDGPGMGWAFFVGPASLTNTALATAYIGCRLYTRVAHHPQDR